MTTYHETLLEMQDAVQVCVVVCLLLYDAPYTTHIVLVVKIVHCSGDSVRRSVGRFAATALRRFPTIHSLSATNGLGSCALVLLDVDIPSD